MGATLTTKTVASHQQYRDSIIRQVTRPNGIRYQAEVKRNICRYGCA
jgi:hypothetical protein